ncbi:hypothetical protein CLV59_103623 [Chitinophaga dinghuensis]|uniref:Uncharacterized protein n=1 Tax=Chitinophaga dinghuensis TaxID=1539050 RepID=A0A327W4E2_9BACT|nr:hypothetical protein CLV59_103623 [Chitinophaga dinghuensis]
MSFKTYFYTFTPDYMFYRGISLTIPIIFLYEKVENLRDCHGANCFWLIERAIPYSNFRCPGYHSK